MDHHVRPNDDRGQGRRARTQFVEGAEERRAGEVDGGLLPGLTDGRVQQRRIVRLDVSTGKSHLPGPWIGSVGRAPEEEQVCIVPVGREHQGHGGFAKRGIASREHGLVAFQRARKSIEDQARSTLHGSARRDPRIPPLCHGR